MRIFVDRKYKKADYTIGKLYINGVYFCDTIEDTDRGLHSGMSLAAIKAAKVATKTAIPSGSYSVTLAVKSPKFSKVKAYDFCGGYLPRLQNVPGYEGCLIHIGNRATETAGCLLVGRNTKVGQVTASTETFRKLYERLKAADKAGEGIILAIQ